MSPSLAMNFFVKWHENEALQHKNTEFSILVWKLKNYSVPWNSKTNFFISCPQVMSKCQRNQLKLNAFSEEWVSTIICEPWTSSVLFECINVRQMGWGNLISTIITDRIINNLKNNAYVKTTCLCYCYNWETMSWVKEKVGKMNQRL